jgi:hypothetical protein
MNVVESSEPFVFKITLIIEHPVKYREELSAELSWDQSDVDLKELELIKSICEKKFDKLCSKLENTVNERLN